MQSIGLQTEEEHQVPATNIAVAVIQYNAIHISVLILCGRKLLFLQSWTWNKHELNYC